MMLQVGDDGVVTSVNEEELVYVDKKELEQFINSYKQLETQIKIFEEFLKHNDLDIEWENFCTVKECPITDENYIDCKDCKHLGWEND